MLYLAWDRKINISLFFFCDVFVWKWGPRTRTSSRCYHGNKSAATFKKGIFVHPPWVPNCMQNLKGGWKFSFPKMLDSYKDLFLISRKKHVFVPSYRGKVGRGEGKGSQNLFWPFKEYQFCLLICHNSDPLDQWHCGFLWSESTGSKQIHKCGKDKKEKRAKPTNHWLYFQGILVVETNVTG